MSFVANFIRFPAVQKFWKSVKIWQSYRKFKGGNFSETQCSLHFRFGRCSRGLHWGNCANTFIAWRFRAPRTKRAPVHYDSDLQGLRLTLVLRLIPFDYRTPTSNWTSRGSIGREPYVDNPARRRIVQTGAVVDRRDCMSATRRSLVRDKWWQTTCTKLDTISACSVRSLNSAPHYRPDDVALTC